MIGCLLTRKPVYSTTTRVENSSSSSIINHYPHHLYCPYQCHQNPHQHPHQHRQQRGIIPHLEVLWEEYRGNKKTKVRELERLSQHSTTAHKRRDE